MREDRDEWVARHWATGRGRWYEEVVTPTASSTRSRDDLETTATYPADAQSTLDDCDIHVWVCLPHEADSSDRAASVLDEAELRRAAGFRFQRDRKRYVAHHAYTRRVLARYLGGTPAAVRIDAGRYGKPQLDPAHGIEFSTSRSNGLSVVAVSHGRIGIDVEAMRPVHDAVEVADMLFTYKERCLLLSTPIEARDGAFMEVWTGKEAVVKAFGTGLSTDLNSFEVLGAVGNGNAHHGWFRSEPFVLLPLDLPAGWKGAVCSLGPGSRLVSMDLGGTDAP